MLPKPGNVNAPNHRMPRNQDSLGDDLRLGAAAVPLAGQVVGHNKSEDLVFTPDR